MQFRAYLGVCMCVSCVVCMSATRRSHAGNFRSPVYASTDKSLRLTTKKRMRI